VAVLVSGTAVVAGAPEVEVEVEVVEVVGVVGVVEVDVEVVAVAAGAVCPFCPIPWMYARQVNPWICNSEPSVWVAEGYRQPCPLT
jgi:hypothetical protein